MVKSWTFRKAIRNGILIALIVVAAQWPVATINAQGAGVINTNYPQPGGTQPAPVRTTPPRYGDYSHMEADPAAITAAERDSVLAQLQKELSAGINISIVNNWQEAKEGQPVLQIVNNLPVQGALYTVVLPANWSRSQKLPILLSGSDLGVSNNQRLWKDADISLITLVARASAAGRTGVIAAYSNVGGSESLGVDEHTYRSVGAFMELASKNGGDPQRVVTTGNGRGGASALMWATNPLKLNYNVVAVFADNPPTAFGSLSQRSVQTYPGLARVYQMAARDPNAYQYGNPNGPGQAKSPMLATLLGTNDPTEADTRSPIDSIAALKGKVVVVSGGTHNPLSPMRDLLNFNHKLTEAGIAHTLILTYGQGNRSSAYLVQQLSAYVDTLTQGKAYQPPSGRLLNINTAPPDGPQSSLSGFLAGDPNATPQPQQSTDLPFTAEFPSKAGVNLPVDLSLCGAAGSTYMYAAKDASGAIWTQGQGTFDATECARAEIKAPATPGEYTWTFTYNGKKIPAVNTPLRNEGGCGLPALTEVTMQQPTPDDLTSSEPSLGFGIDQYSAQEQGCGL